MSNPTPPPSPPKTPTVLFFYAGNEADVDTYQKHTGLMWENAAQFNAIMIFAEHRFYGASLPCDGGYLQCGEYLRIQQVLADYATLITHAKRDFFVEKVIAFGGSYGGMLAAYLRVQYPDLVAGAIAASAPVFGITGSSLVNDGSYWAIVTNDVLPCSKNISDALYEVSEKSEADLRDVFNICKNVPSGMPGAISAALTTFIIGGLDAMSMGNYPYSSDYMSNADGVFLPAYPMQQVCKAMQDSSLRSLKNAIDIYYNASKKVSCYDLTASTASVSNIWDYQVCAECLPQEIPYYARLGSPNDMFLATDPWDMEYFTQYCLNKYSFAPNCTMMQDVYNLNAFQKSSNIIFSNGEYDPWRAYGVTQDLNPTVKAVYIEKGAHHLDLMFSNTNDPESVRTARKLELAQISEWLKK